MKSKQKNEGAKLLEVSMKAKGWSGADLAEHLGVTRMHVNHLTSGRRKPGRVLGQMLLELFGIEAMAWDMKSE